MKTKTPPKWLLLLVQLPKEPSSARVALWRRLRGAGAVSVINGVWALPYSDEHAELLASASVKVGEQGGRSTVFLADPMDERESGGLIAQARADRGRDYDEFAERSDAMLAEIEKETCKRKFTFAELEEIEQDFEKLTDWLAKIERRDFFPDVRLKDAKERLGKCSAALGEFSEKVLVAEGVSEDQNGQS